MARYRCSIRAARLAVMAVAIVLSRSSGVQAQATAPDSIHKALDKQVSLRPGRSTLAGFLGELSAQTGIHVACEPGLTNRVLVVTFANASGAAALESVTELLGLKWAERGSGDALVFRPDAEPEGGPRGVPLAVKAALPLDIASYLRIGAPAADIPILASDPDARYMNAIRANPLQHDEFVRKFVTGRITSELQRRCTLLAMSTGVQVATTITRWNDLDSGQRDLCIDCLALSALLHTCQGPGLDVYHNALKPYVLDPSAAAIHLRSGNMLVIGTRTRLGNAVQEAGFGIALPGAAPSAPGAAAR